MPDLPDAALPDEIKAAASQNPVGDGATGGDVGDQAEDIEEGLGGLSIVGDLNDGVIQRPNLHGAPAVELFIGVALQILGEHGLYHLGLGLGGSVDGGVVGLQGLTSGVVAAVDAQGDILSRGPEILQNGRFFFQEQAHDVFARQVLHVPAILKPSHQFLGVESKR